jgi:hypothetical protein
MTLYRFHVVCPHCNKPNDYIWQKRRLPEPRVSCGDCLMERVEIVPMKVIKVEEDANENL